MPKDKLGHLALQAIQPVARLRGGWGLGGRRIERSHRGVTGVPWRRLIRLLTISASPGSSPLRTG